MNAALYGLATGLATGIVMTRWGLCFNRSVRQAFLEGRPRVLRAFDAAADGAQAPRPERVLQCARHKFHLEDVPVAVVAL